MKTSDQFKFGKPSIVYWKRCWHFYSHRETLQIPSADCVFINILSFRGASYRIFCMGGRVFISFSGLLSSGFLHNFCVWCIFLVIVANNILDFFIRFMCYSPTASIYVCMYIDLFMKSVSRLTSLCQLTPHTHVVCQQSWRARNRLTQCMHACLYTE